MPSPDSVGTNHCHQRMGERIADRARDSSPLGVSLACESAR
jgi:hypothetical protein